MNRDQKAAVVEELAEQIRSADAIFAVDYRGISVAQAADLRVKLRDADTRFRIVKNSLTERASDAAGADTLRPLLEGPTALAFVSGDAAAAAKALNDAARTLGTLEFKGGVMDGASLSADEVRSIARLPSRDILHGQLVGTIAAPLSGLVRTLNALIAGVAMQLGQMAEKGLVSGADPAPPSEAGSAQAQDETAVVDEETRPASDADSEPPQAEAEAAPIEAEAASAPEAQVEAEPAPDPEAAPQESEPETEASAEEPQAEETEEE